MNDSIFELTQSCLGISEQRINVRIEEIPIQKRVSNNVLQLNRVIDFTVEGETKLFVQSVSNLAKALLEKYPTIALQLQEHVSKYYGREIIIHHSAIIAILKCLIALKERAQQCRKRKVFISHSSKDKDIMKNFTNLILGLGIGIEANDVFCTSIEDMTMRNGEDIRQHIKDNILSADYSFLMLSKNYQSSEICLNEMGAVWAANNNVRCYLLPDADFDKIGWLTNPQKAEKINSSIALDALQKELVDFYGLQDRGITWSKNREDFLATLNS